MKPVREVVSRDVIEDLWGAGYTILPRPFHSLDPFEIDTKLIPRDRAYQWFHLVYDVARFDGSSPWAPVPASRHDGWFMPAGHVGNIEVNGLGLFEKPKDEVDKEKADNVNKAKQLVADWAQQAAEIGISGGVKIGGIGLEVGNDEGMKAEAFKTSTKTIETTVRVPADMFPHMDEVFAERDRLYAELQSAWERGDALQAGGWQDKVIQAYREALEDDSDILKGPTFNALLLPYAVENVRKKLKGQSDE